MILELTPKQKYLTFAILSIISILISVWIGKNVLLQSFMVCLFSYLSASERLTLLYVIFKTFPRDVKGTLAFIKVNYMLSKYERNNLTVPKLFCEIAKKHPDKVAFMMDDVKLTFQEVDNISNSIASYFKQKNFCPGDTVALFMEANPYYPCIWLGLSKVGICTALINTNLNRIPLAHCIRIAYSKAIIVGSELAKTFEEVRNDEGIKDLPVYQYRNIKEKENSNYEPIIGSEELTTELQKRPFVDFSDELKNGQPRDKLVYIYTSGTTGLPKAAVITNLRFLFMVNGSYYAMGLTTDDIIYTSLPLYHTAGGMISVGSTLARGITLAIRTKFSASNFWTDCIRYNATVAQYIGEICRYLLSTPEKPTDTQHKIRLMIGNGLRAQIWTPFVKRFNIPKIGELYGSTEGISNLANIDNTVGAVGFVPRLAMSLYPVTLIRCFEGTNEPIRDYYGRCMPCKPGEPGVFIGRINPKKAISNFNGYVDKKASKKKVLENVFKEGDKYFDSGDVLVMDIYGYFFFKDRLGDTFRWKGENVSTTEVEAIVSNIVGLQDCIAYGVEIPNTEGKAGMVAIVDLKRQTDIEVLSKKIRENLPSYARPVFVRIVEKAPITGTFKLVKTDLQTEGYNIKTLVKDPIYIIGSNGLYVPFTKPDYEDIINGRLRL